jgi:hypothetical protein
MSGSVKHQAKPRKASSATATAVICGFIASVARTFGIVPVCRALTGHGIAISPRTYHARRSRPPSRRAVRDAWLTALLQAVFDAGGGFGHVAFVIDAFARLGVLGVEDHRVRAAGGISRPAGHSQASFTTMCATR